MISSQEVIDDLFKVELSLFCKFYMEKGDGVNMLKYGYHNEIKFPNVGFLCLIDFGHLKFTNQNGSIF